MYGNRCGRAALTFPAMSVMICDCLFQIHEKQQLQQQQHNHEPAD
jgi:hypothetical protein